MICPDCEDTLVKTMREVNSGWEIVWLCECEPSCDDIDEATTEQSGDWNAKR